MNLQKLKYLLLLFLISCGATSSVEKPRLQPITGSIFFDSKLEIYCSYAETASGYKCLPPKLRYVECENTADHPPSYHLYFDVDTDLGLKIAKSMKYVTSSVDGNTYPVIDVKIEKLYLIDDFRKGVCDWKEFSSPIYKYVLDRSTPVSVDLFSK
jgi:hypothetical protein